MSKSIYERAIETLNKYRNQNYNSTNKDEVELANAINVILPNYVKQEKLLELYKRLNKVQTRLSWYKIHTINRDKIEKYEREVFDITKQIKELEK